MAPSDDADPATDTPSDTHPGPAAPAMPRVLPTWAWRLCVAGALIVAFAVLIIGGQRNVVGQVDDVQKVEIITAKEPAPGAKVLRQSAIGAVLKPGYDGRLTINGVAIPEDQMEGAIDQSSISSADLARYGVKSREELERLGVRPNNRNRVFFTPGPGKVIEKYDSGPVEVVLTYFREFEADTTSQTSTWTVTVD